MKRILTIILSIFMCVSSMSMLIGCAPKDGKDGKDGTVVTIGENGNWYLDGIDSGVPATTVGKDGEDGKDGIDGVNGVDGIDGIDGKDGTKITIGENGNWYLDGVDSGVSALNYGNAPRKIYEHVVIVGVDGGGAWFDDADMPNLDAIFKDGATTDYCVSSNPSMSAGCWASMLTGVNTNLNGITTNDTAKNQRYENQDYPTIFGLLYSNNNNAKMSSYATWENINYGIIEENIGVDKQTFSDEQISKEECDNNNVTAYINKISTGIPQLSFIQLDSVDVAGHAYGFGSNEYFSALHDVDEMIGKIYTAIKDAGALDDTLFIVTTDHGGVLTDHVGESPEEYNCFFGAAGKNIIRNNNLKMYSRDIAAITCWALGIEGNEKWQAEIPQNMFKDARTPTRKRVDYSELQKMWLTPTKNTVSHLFNYIDVEKLQAGLFFDGSASDVVGTHVATATDKITYENGFYGLAARTSNQGAYVYYSDITNLSTSFSLALWFKADKTNEVESTLISNKDWNSGRNQGLNVSWLLNRNDYTDANKRTIWYNHADGSNRHDDYDFLPDINTYGDWMHVLLSIDLTKKTTTCYINFNYVGSSTIEIDQLDANTANKFSIGSDGLGNYGFNGLVDDFLLFNQALTYDEIMGLKNYYAQ